MTPASSKEGFIDTLAFNGAFRILGTFRAFSVIFFPTAVFLTGLRRALLVAEALNITAVDVLYNAKDGQTYLVFDISDGIKTNIETVLNILASIL